MIGTHVSQREKDQLVLTEFRWEFTFAYDVELFGGVVAVFYTNNNTPIQKYKQIR